MEQSTGDSLVLPRDIRYEFISQEYIMNPSGWKVTVLPSSDPVTLVEAKTQTKVTNTSSDDLLTALISAATQWCEAYEGRLYVTQTITVNYNNWGCPSNQCLILPRPDAASISGIKYIDTDGNQQSLASNQYKLENFSYTNFIYPEFEVTWPDLRNQINAVEVVYLVGSSQATVTEQRKAAIKLVLAHLFEHREQDYELTLKELPLGAKSLLSERYRSL